ncbi:hypothetical protein SCE1572_11125 [Sorangium cellulosum So0157-2]|uniref:Uncharacterized protein n=1 Tax=Sorangium cellulosum So0157-2 TaxID=1254432 RepID=S4XPB5_SORCE|nr:hypothetical protein SCE1572_11125 [Sorangium cellulosum So0157-2]
MRTTRSRRGRAGDERPLALERDQAAPRPW